MQKETKGSDKSEKKEAIGNPEKKAEQAKGDETKNTQKESVIKETEKVVNKWKVTKQRICKLQLKIPCSQMRNVPHMLQWQNACCNFDSAYVPLNLTHLDDTKGEESQEDEENEEEDDTEENGSQEDGEDSNNGWVHLYNSVDFILQIFTLHICVFWLVLITYFTLQLQEYRRCSVVWIRIWYWLGRIKQGVARIWSWT